MVMLKKFPVRLPAADDARYNLNMRTRQRHPWAVTPARAREIQTGLAGEIVREGEPSSVRLVGGIDVSVNRWAKTGTAAVVVLSYPAMALVEVSKVTDTIPFPYVPGLLSFREAPLVLAACEQLKATPDVLLVDGQGIAHPRRIGLASHLGLCLDAPTIGCAKSRLCGTHEEPALEAGSAADLTDGGEVIGAVLRTKTKVKPLYISVGHRISLAAAVKLVLACGKGYRLPEPTRLAHQTASGHLNEPSAAARRQPRAGKAR